MPACTPFERCHGTTPDVLAHPVFQFWEKVTICDDKVSFPSTKGRPGHCLGVENRCQHVRTSHPRSRQHFACLKRANSWTRPTSAKTLHRATVRFLANTDCAFANVLDLKKLVDGEAPGLPKHDAALWKKHVMKRTLLRDAPKVDMVLMTSDPKHEKETAKQIVKSGVFSSKRTCAFCATSR